MEGDYRSDPGDDSSESDDNRHSLPTETTSQVEREVISQPNHEDTRETSTEAKAEDSIRHLSHLANAMASGHSANEDTVMFLKPPPRAPGQTHALYQDVVRRYRWPIFGRSEVIKQYAPEFYEKFFSVSYQPRYRRRFASKLREHPAWNKRYILDLTPAIEGDEAIESVSQLQCPRGILYWHLSMSRFGCRAELVNGHLDLEDGVGLQDYSQIRHNLAIERLFLALHGHNPNFDSAIKVYTTAMLSRQFNLTAGPLQDWVISWFRSANNSVCIEVLPEATLAMANSLRIGSLAIEAFAILLGEACLEPSDRSKTIHNRTRYEIDDGWRSRMQYAKQSFEARVEGAFTTLTESAMRWVDGLAEYQKLLHAKQAAFACGSHDTWRRLTLNLKTMIRKAIFYCLYSDLAHIPAHGFDGDGPKIINDLYGSIDYRTAWRTLLPEKRRFTRLFWCMMVRIRLDHFGESGYDFRDVSSHDEFYFLPNSAMGRFIPHSDSDSIGSIELGLRQLRFAFQAKLDLHVDPDGVHPLYYAKTRSPQTTITGSDRDMVESSLQDLSDFSLRSFFRQAEEKIVEQARPMLEMAIGSTTRASELQVTNVLLSLTEEEIQYLPLWAGGNDDGTGGVFEIDVPQAVDGFSSHGPFIHRENDSCAVSEYSFITRSTDVPSSIEVNDGFSDTLDRRRVYATSEVDSDISWTDVLEYRGKKIFRGTAEVESLPETAFNWGEESQQAQESDNDVSEGSFDVIDSPTLGPSNSRSSKH